MKTKEQKSKAFSKIVKTISSCETSDHVISTRTMIKNYFNLFKDEHPDAKYDVMVFNEELNDKEISLCK